MTLIMIHYYANVNTAVPKYDHVTSFGANRQFAER
jgi:hypothetical protein